jgi:hypothetical protein
MINLSTFIQIKSADMRAESFLGSTEKMEGVAQILKHCEGQGFTERFIVLKNALYAPSADKIYQPEEIRIVDTYRYEGLTDPDDNSIVYALVCSDGIKGTVVDAYGVYANGIFARLAR